MSSEMFHLWGFDGELHGNEERLQARLPMFTRDDSGDVFLAKKLRWSPELPAGDVVRMSAEDAAEAGERLALHRPLAVAPGQYVVIVGPKMKARLWRVGSLWHGVSLQDSFSVRVMSAPAFEQYATNTEKLAMTTFDAAMGRENVSLARTALHVMRNLGVDNTRQHIVRALALHFVAGESDAFLRVLRLGAARLDEDEQRLKSEMHELLEFVRRSHGVKRLGTQRVPDRVKVAASPYTATLFKPAEKALPTAMLFKGGTYSVVSFKDGKFGDILKVTNAGSDRVDSKKLMQWIIAEE